MEICGWFVKSSWAELAANFQATKNLSNKRERKSRK